MGDVWLSTLRSLRAHPVRFGLTSAGVLWGAFMLTFLSASMAGFNEHFRRELAEAGPKIVILFPGFVYKNRVGERAARPVELDNDDVARIERLHSVEDADPDILLWSQIVRAGRRMKLLHVSGGNEQTARIRNLEVAQGRFLTRTDVERGARVAFLGPRAAERLFGNQPAIGRTIQIESLAFRVIGISQAKGEQLIHIHGLEDLAVIIPYTTAQRHFTHSEKLGRIAFTPTTAEGSFDAIRHARQLMGLHHDFDPGLKTALSFMNIYEALRDIYGMQTALRVFLIAAGGITLLVGAIGVMNIMLVVVHERVSEIGLRKAVGGTSRAIFVQFLAEAVAVCGGSGLLGTGLGVAATQVVGWLSPPGSASSSPPLLDPVTVIAVAASLVAVGLVAGVAPAMRAARVPPAEALRAG